MSTEITVNFIAQFGSRAAALRHVLPRLAAMSVAAVWLVHGVYNKLLGGSTRHLAIVQSVPGLGGAAGEWALQAVGVIETGLAVWVLSGRQPYLCAAVQTSMLLGMNAVELTFARHLLLWPAGLVPVNLAFLALAWIAADSSLLAALRARLRRHPMPIVARLQDCLTMTYALPARVLRPLLPPGLDLDTVGEYGFVAVALVQTRRLRPAGTPRALGQDFFLAGYRIFTRFRLPDGRAVRGLRILRSDADSGRMVVAGNLLTHYHYHRCHVRIDADDDHLDVAVRTPDGAGDLDVRADLTDATLPPGSPFSSVREARRFAGPLPFTFDYEEETHSIVAIEARRTGWRPALVSVKAGRTAFFDHSVFAGCAPRLAAAFHVRNVDYSWRRGRLCPLARRDVGLAAPPAAGAPQAAS